jgi:hypothetical protein
MPPPEFELEMVSPADMNSLLDNDLHSTITPEHKLGIIQAYWGDSMGVQLKSVEEGIYDPFFEYYTKQCDLALLNGGRNVFVRKHSEVIRIINLFKAGLDRQAIFEQFRDQLHELRLKVDDLMVERTIDFAARVFSMISFGDLPDSHAGLNILHWSTGSIQESLAQRLDQPPTRLDEHINFEKLFDARNLGRVGGIHIKWTSNLAEHLSIKNDDEIEKVALFHHASFLKLHQKRYD